VNIPHIILLHKMFRYFYEIMSENTQRLTINMKTAIGLLEIFLIAILVALFITVAYVPTEVKFIALGAVSPFVILTIVFIHYCRRGKLWSFAGASILGAAGVLLRVAVSTQPNLEVGGGLPVGVTILYIVIGALVSLINYESVLELRAKEYRAT